MSKTLIIVESPTKAKTISKFLGKDYKVVSSMGHIRDLPKSKLSIDPEKNFEIKYEIPVKAKKTVSELKKLAKDYPNIILATDEDREGEAISWHLAYILKLDSKKAKRMVFHEITKKAIEEALKNPRTIDQNLVDAQQARRALDRIVGYKLSPFLWSKVQRGLSAGRVQSVALKLIVDREREINAFSKEEYWSITGFFDAKDKSYPIVANLSHIDDKKLDKFYLKNEEDSNSLLSKIVNLDYYVDSIETKKATKSPYPPFITSTLQQDASRRLYFSSKQTMMIAQQLYEGISLGTLGQTGLITYMRTDSTFLSEQALFEANKVILNLYGKEYTLDSPRRFKTKSKNAQEAHEAIRPTNPNLHPDDIKQYLDDTQYKLYNLIWRRFMATQMSVAIFENTNLSIKDTKEKKYKFIANGKTQKFDGFMRVYNISSEDVLLPSVEENELLKTEKIVPEQHFTQPPGRYTESSLIKMLEKYDIGRPSTYSSIISTIQSREYVARNDEKRFYPTEIGIIVTEVLEKNFQDIVDVEFTAKVEQQFDHISNGDETYQQMLSEFYNPFISNLKEKEQSVDRHREILTDRSCPECGSELEYKRGRFGKFVSCTNYPDCKFTDKIEEDKKFDQEHGGEACDKCSDGIMTVKRGRFGPFLACSNYPACKNIKKIEEKTGEKCPKCEIGDIVWKKGKKRGLKFKACNRYPDCDYIENAKKTTFTKKKAIKKAAKVTKKK